MTNNPFVAPAQAGSLPLEELVGSLLIILPTEYRPEVVTTNGTKDAIAGDAFAVDGPHAGEEFNNVLIFGRVLIGQLRTRMGQKVLGRLAQGVAKPGQKPPWTLNDPTDQDVAQGIAFLNRQQSQQFAPPAQQQQPQGYQQPPQQNYAQPPQQPVYQQQPQGWTPAPTPQQWPQQPSYDEPPF